MEFLNLMTFQVFHDLYEGAVALKRTRAWDGNPLFFKKKKKKIKFV